MAPARWRTQLAGPAKDDFAAILVWTSRSFGPAQAVRYARLLRSGLHALHEGPALLRTRSRPELGLGVMSFKPSGGGQKCRHNFYFELRPGRQILILRILHDSLDPTRHLPTVDP